MILYHTPLKQVEFKKIEYCVEPKIKVNVSNLHKMLYKSVKKDISILDKLKYVIVYLGNSLNQEKALILRTLQRLKIFMRY